MGKGELEERRGKGRTEEKGRPEKLEAAKGDHWFVEWIAVAGLDTRQHRTNNLD